MEWWSRRKYIWWKTWWWDENSPCGDNDVESSSSDKKEEEGIFTDVSPWERVSGGRHSSSPSPPQSWSKGGAWHWSSGRPAASSHSQAKWKRRARCAGAEKQSNMRHQMALMLILWSSATGRRKNNRPSCDIMPTRIITKINRKTFGEKYRQQLREPVSFQKLFLFPIWKAIYLAQALIFVQHLRGL